MQTISDSMSPSKRFSSLFKKENISVSSSNIKLVNVQKTPNGKVSQFVARDSSQDNLQVKVVK